MGTNFRQFGKISSCQNGASHSAPARGGRGGAQGGKEGGRHGGLRLQLCRLFVPQFSARYFRGGPGSRRSEGRGSAGQPGLQPRSAAPGRQARPPAPPHERPPAPPPAGPPHLPSRAAPRRDLGRGRRSRASAPRQRSLRWPGAARSPATAASQTGFSCPRLNCQPTPHGAGSKGGGAGPDVTPGLVLANRRSRAGARGGGGGTGLHVPGRRTQRPELTREGPLPAWSGSSKDRRS